MYAVISCYINRSVSATCLDSFDLQVESIQVSTQQKHIKSTMRKVVLCFTLLSIFGASFAGIKGGKKSVTDQQALDELTKAVGEHLKKLDGQANGGNLELIRLHSATSQTVAGSKFEIVAELNENSSPVNCTIGLWVKPWMDFVKLDVECGEEIRKYAYASHAESRRKRQIPTLGGFQDINQDGLNAYFLDISSIFDLLSSQHSDFDVTLKRVVSGKSQVDAGSHAIVNVEAVLRTNADAVKHCEVDLHRNLKGAINRAEVKCEHHDRRFRVH